MLTPTRTRRSLLVSLLVAACIAFPSVPYASHSWAGHVIDANARRPGAALVCRAPRDQIPIGPTAPLTGNRRDHDGGARDRDPRPATCAGDWRTSRRLCHTLQHAHF